MKSSEIKQGETYMFVATDSQARKHLEGEPFTVFRIQSVWRRFKKKGTRKVKRFFNEAGDGAKAEELEPMPEDTREFPCTNCEAGEYRFAGRVDTENMRYRCNECGDEITLP